MNILTFDVEDWFHLLDNPATADEERWGGFEPRIHQGLDRIFAALERHQHRATFFCLGWVAEKYPEIIRRIDALGYEVASHSNRHQLVYNQTPMAFREDLSRSIALLEDVTGKKVKAYRAPGFSFIRGNPWAFEALIELGIEVDSSIFPAPRGHGGYDNFGSAQPTILTCGGGEIKEFPINLGNILGKRIVFSGGGYFRLLPYFLIQKMTKQSKYIMTYFHARDFDAEQPVLELPFHRKFKSYVGLKGAYEKFDRWLGENNFIDLEHACGTVNWGRAPHIMVD